MDLSSSMLYIWRGLRWMDGMAIIGNRSSKSTFGASNNEDDGDGDYDDDNDDK